MAQASAVIQNAAKGRAIQLGPLRESSGRASAKELTSIQLEGSGPAPAALGFLHQSEMTGYPLLVDALQMTPDTTKPGQLKVTMTIVILDFDQWKDLEVPWCVRIRKMHRESSAWGWRCSSSFNSCGC